MADRQTTVSGEWLVTDFDAVPITYRATYPATLKDGHRGPGGFDVPFVTLDVARQIADDQQEMVAAAIAAADASDVEMDTLVETSEGVFTLTASYGEQWNVTAGADGLYDFGFGWSWYEVDTPEPEETISADDDEWTCICGNDAMDSGFFPCLADGTAVEPTETQWTDGLLYLCFSCGRIIRDRGVADGGDQDRDRLAPLVVGRRDLDARPLTRQEILGDVDDEPKTDEAVRTYEYRVTVRVAVNTETREVRGVEIADEETRSLYGFRLLATGEER